MIVFMLLLILAAILGGFYGVAIVIGFYTACILAGVIWGVVDEYKSRRAESLLAAYREMENRHA